MARRLRIRRTDIGQDTPFVDWGRRICANCGSRDEDIATCRLCGGEVAFACLSCDIALQPIEIVYETFGKLGFQHRVDSLAHTCPSCQTVHLHQSTVESSQEIADKSPPDLTTIPGQGIATSAQLEVVVWLDQDAASASSRSRSILGLAVRIGRPSHLFEAWIGHLASYDSRDFELVTLKLVPGPPYDEDTRREIHVLLARIGRKFEVPLRFSGVEIDPQAREKHLLEYSSLIERWNLDSDRRVLALLNESLFGPTHSEFINCFRMLELVLSKLHDEDLRKARFDRAIGMKEFLDLAKGASESLAARLRSRIRKMHIQPKDTLRRLWALIRPGRRYNENEVYESIVSLRNAEVHAPPDARHGETLLPWEERPFDVIADHLMELNLALICDK